MELNLEALEALIKRGDFEELKGKYENAYFDCKSEVYLLNYDNAKYELAKDVAAFANAQGGFILIGIKTEKCKESISDKIVDIRYLEKNLCNPEQYINSIQAWIYPKLNGVLANWCAAKPEQDRGIFVIAIPPQSDSKKPFLVNNTLIDSKRRNAVLFGYCERIQEGNEPRSVEVLHQLLRNGLNYQTNIDTRLQSIESLLQQKVSVNPSLPTEEVFDIMKRAQAALAAAEMTNKRLMLMYAYPESPRHIKLLLSSKADGPRSLLAAPPQIRERGFGTRVIKQPIIIGGNGIRVQGGSRKIIDLYKDGLLLAAFSADEDFLCWAMKHHLFNPVALVETIVTFVMLYGRVLPLLDEKPREISFTVEVRNLHLRGEKNILAEGSLDNIEAGFEDEMHYAPDDSWSTALSFKINEFNERKIAYSLLEVVYNYFGIDSAYIPYTKEIDGERIVDTEKIAAI